MMTKEVPNEEWDAFCNRFTEVSRDHLLTMEMGRRYGTRWEVFRDLPLRQMRLQHDPCNDIIIVEAGEKGSPRLHTMIEPIHLKVRQNGEGQKFLEIIAETGTSYIHFHAGRFPQALAELLLEG